MNDTGVITTAALSGKVDRSEGSEISLVQNTAALWGDAHWSIGYLRSDGYLCSDGYLWSDGALLSDEVRDVEPLFNTQNQSILLNND